MNGLHSVGKKQGNAHTRLARNSGTSHQVAAEQPRRPARPPAARHPRQRRVIAALPRRPPSQPAQRQRATRQHRQRMTRITRRRPHVKGAHSHGRDTGRWSGTINVAECAPARTPGDTVSRHAQAFRFHVLNRQEQRDHPAPRDSVAEIARGPVRLYWRRPAKVRQDVIAIRLNGRSRLTVGIPLLLAGSANEQ